MNKSYSEIKAEVIVKELGLPDTYIPILKIKLQSIVADVKVILALGAEIN